MITRIFSDFLRWLDRRIDAPQPDAREGINRVSAQLIERISAKVATKASKRAQR